jgi:predicted alpha/beta superfamily hydrolase
LLHRAEPIKFLPNLYNFSLFGRSDSGLFALYALTVAPDAFQAVIASSPSLGRCPTFMADRVKKLFRERPSLAKTLFIIYGANRGPSVAVRIPEFAALIKIELPRKFRSWRQKYPRRRPHSQIQLGGRASVYIRDSILMAAEASACLLRLDKLT